MKTFVISDPHFHHNNIIRYCNRPFSSVENMNSSLIINWNNVVGTDDLVVVNGDFMMGKYDLGIFNYLKGKKILVKGNHDHKATYELGWESVHDIFEFRDNGKKVVMCHYPIEIWNEQSHSSVHLYGHVHDKSVGHKPNRHNICVEKINYTPQNIEEYTIRNYVNL
jgi:calcineurin-like phosphoesterase family protein